MHFFGATTKNLGWWVALENLELVLDFQGHVAKKDDQALDEIHGN